jgi:hypothetical protein
LIQQHPHQFGVMVIEPAPQRFDEGRAFGPHPAAGQVGEPPRITFTGDQGVEHVAHRQGVEGGGDARNLDQRVFEQLLQPLPVAAALPGQIDPQPRVVPQRPDRCRRHETRSQQPFLGELGQPHGVQLVLARPGTFLTSRALTSCTASPADSSR